MIFKKQLFSIFLLLTIIDYNSVFAQQQLSPDELFQQARTAAFDKKDYLLQRN
jgi:hypothetical protein